MAAYIAAVVLAVIGVVWYASSPGVASYQANRLLLAPLLAILLWRLHRVLPSWLQWSGAVVLALIGPTGYLVFGGAQWWNWGQLALLPLCLLVVRVARTSPDVPTTYTPPTDGPWGPP